MALPKLASAKYELTLPSTGEKVEFRPFLVKEEKALMLAQQENNQSAMVRAVEDIISACTFDKLKPKELPIFDIEYVFLKLRSKSIGEISKLTVKCPDDNETEVEVEVNLSEVECHKEVGHNNNIKITDDIGVVLNYPNVDSIKSLDNSDETGATFDVISSCISQIYDADNVYARNDMDKKELDEFIESMSHDQFEKIQDFFATMPKVKHSVKIKNPKTGVDSEIVLEGLSDFF